MVISPSLRFIVCPGVPALFHFLYCSTNILHIDEKARAQKTSIEPRIDMKNLSLFFLWRFHHMIHNWGARLLYFNSGNSTHCSLYEVLSGKLALRIVRYRWYVTEQFASDPLLMNEARIFRCSLRVFRRMRKVREFGYLMGSICDE